MARILVERKHVMILGLTPVKNDFARIFDQTSLNTGSTIKKQN
jgi:hypothetical protein